jgi:AraC family transcriptional regulator
VSLVDGAGPSVRGSKRARIVNSGGRRAASFGGVTLIRDMLRLLAAVNRRRRDDVSLPALSALAHRSPFNLHRGFVRVVGETPKAYTSRVRLARAAADLLSTDRPVSVIASDHGFAGHEVFARAFTRHFGVSPRTYRARGPRAGDDRAAAVHAATVDSVAPCVGLYRMTTAERKAPVSTEIHVKDLPAVHALVMRRHIARDEIAATLAECLPALFAYAQRGGLAMAGPPFARYPEMRMGSLVIEGGVPLAAPASGDADAGIEALTIPAGPAAVAIHRGPYERLQETYQAIESWLREEGRQAGGPPWETYLTDPGEYPDPETWETEIVQPLG